MNLDLPPALDAFVKDLVAQGRYADEAEVVRDALRRMAERDVAQLQSLRDALMEGELSGPPRPFDSEPFIARKGPA